MERLKLTITESNRQTRDGWARYASHRAMVHELITGRASDTAALCLLGPGNMNDVDARRLLAEFRRLHLVDLDMTTVRAAARRQGVGPHPGLVMHDPTDLTGVLGLLDRSPTPDLADQVERVLAGHVTAVPGAPFDACVSTCVLTQLLQSVVDSTVPRERVPGVSIALRDKHLRDLVALTGPGGSVILVTDVVSTTTAPGLLTVDPAAMESEMARLVAAGNFFTGTNPYRIVALFEEDPWLCARLTDVRLAGPWLWSVTNDRQHLVVAVTARRT